MAVQKAVYQVYIDETLCKAVNIAAWSPEDAKEYARKLYDEGSIVLNWQNFVDFDVEVDSDPINAEPDYETED